MHILGVDKVQTCTFKSTASCDKLMYPYRYSYYYFSDSEGLVHLYPITNEKPEEVLFIGVLSAVSYYTCSHTGPPGFPKSFLIDRF